MGITGSAVAAKAATRKDTAKAIILDTLLRVAQDFVGFVDFLEFGFRLRVVRIGIRMIFFRQPAESLFDFFFTGVFAYAQNIIVILCHYTTHQGSDSIRTYDCILYCMSARSRKSTYRRNF